MEHDEKNTKYKVVVSVWSPYGENHANFIAKALCKDYPNLSAVVYRVETIPKTNDYDYPVGTYQSSTFVQPECNNE